MCYSKKEFKVITEDETGYALAFSTAAKAVIAAKQDDATAKTWHDAIEASRSADQETVATAVKDSANKAAFKQNFDDEFIMAWAMLLVDTFDADSEAQKKFYADVALAEGANPLGTEFGTIFKSLEGDAATKAKAALAKMCLAGKTSMYIPKVQAMLKACIKAKGYEKNLGDFTTMMVNAKALKDLGKVLMPFHADATDAQKDLDKL